MLGLPTIVEVSPEPPGIAFNFQGDSLAGFILMCRRPFSPFPTNKLIQCIWRIFGQTVSTLYLNVLHIYFWLRLSFFSELCTSPTARNFYCASSFVPFWLTRPVSYPIEPLYWVVTLMAFLKRSKYSWFVPNFCCLHWNTGTYVYHVVWVSYLFPSNLNMTPLMRFSIPITYWSRSMASYFLSPPSLVRRLSVHCPWIIVNALSRFSSSISSLSTIFYFILQYSLLGHS